MIVKKIKLELDVGFSDDFTPPEKFSEYWRTNKCSGCPFYYFQDDYGTCECAILFSDSDNDDCPIRKFF